jgi:glycine/D-amino acid oxidase-like deaminating enzyme
VKTVPFWTDDFGRPPDLATAENAPAKTDVVVVGAGLTGLNAAIVLRRAGVEVAVVDAGAVGAGASTVNGGQVNYGLKAATPSVFKRYGPALGRAFWQASLDSIDAVERVIADEAIDCNFVRPGAAELGYRARDLDDFHKEAEWLADKLGFQLDVLGPERVGEVIASPLFHCAAVDHVGASLHPARYTYGLAAAAARSGAAIIENAPVTSIERTGTTLRVTAGSSTIVAGSVLLATNGYTDALRPFLHRRVLPIGSYMVATEPLRPDVAERLIPGGRAFWTARRFLNYFRRSPDNRILMGGRNDLAPDLDLGDSARRLGTTIAQVFPELADMPLTHSWTGRLGVTFDFMPHIGNLDGVWYALGYGGHGVGIGTYLGQEVARLITGELDSSPFAEISHPGRWYFRGNPWFYPLAARWYRLLDRFGL